MTQKSRPSEDVSNSGWTPASNYYRMINEPDPDDAASMIVSGNNPQGSTFEVELASLAWPSAGLLGPQTLRVRLKQTALGTMPVTIYLVQGTQVIAAKVVQPTTAFDTYLMTLTPEQTEQITDYRDLRLRVKAGVTNQTCPYCQGNQACATYQAAFSGFTTPFAYLNGTT